MASLRLPSPMQTHEPQPSASPLGGNAGPEKILERLCWYRGAENLLVGLVGVHRKGRLAFPLLPISVRMALASVFTFRRHPDPTLGARRPQLQTSLSPQPLLVS